jgi:hypothetical protein
VIELLIEIENYQLSSLQAELSSSSKIPCDFSKKDPLVAQM